MTGDYKFDQTPVGGRRRRRLAPRRARPRRACSASAATRPTPTGPGSRPSESSVGPALLEAFSRCEGRIIVTCFASNVHRVQQVIDAAVQLDRKVALVGRSMRKNFNIASNLGIASAPDGMLIQPKEIEDFPDERVVAISTGSQGEPLSALRRMAHDDHPDVELHSGDTVIFSATPGARQRARGLGDDRPHLPDRRLGRDRRRRADPRLGPRLAGGAEADAQPDQAALRDARPTATTSGCTCTPSSPRRSGSSPSGSSRAATASRSRSTSTARRGSARTSTPG